MLWKLTDLALASQEASRHRSAARWSQDPTAGMRCQTPAVKVLSQDRRGSGSAQAMRMTSSATST